MTLISINCTLLSVILLTNGKLLKSLLIKHTIVILIYNNNILYNTAYKIIYIQNNKIYFILTYPLNLKASLTVSGMF